VGFQKDGTLVFFPSRRELNAATGGHLACIRRFQLRARVAAAIVRQPLPSQTRACAIDALGSSRRTPLAGPGMTDARHEQRMAGEEFVKRVPGKAPSARPPTEPLMPEVTDLPVEPLQAAEVRRPAVVLVVSSEFGVERHRLILDRV